MISETATPPATEVLPERLLETPLEDLAATVAGLSAETRRKLQCYIERMMTNAMATACQDGDDPQTTALEAALGGPKRARRIRQISDLVIGTAFER